MLGNLGHGGDDGQAPTGPGTVWDRHKVELGWEGEEPPVHWEAKHPMGWAGLG